MDGARKRRGGSRASQKRVSFAISNDDLEGNMSIAKRITKHKFYIIGIGIALLILIFVLWPAPKLSQHAQNWHDSGYIFKFRQHEIFYQDIVRVSSPFKLEPVLLILHGFPTSSYDWKHLIGPLHKRFPRVIIPDLLGLGFSDKPSGYSYTIEEQATMQEELLHKLNVTDIHILAHDYGDTVAQELIARDNDPEYHLNIRIKSICLSNGGIIPTHYNPRPIQKALLIPVLKTLLLLVNNQFLFNSRFSAVFGPNTQPSSEILNDFWSILLYKGGHMAFSDILVYLAERETYKDRWIGALQHTKIPLHLIYGPMDPINTPEGFLATYKKLITQSTYTVLENIGHYPQIEDEKGFMKSYEEFLKRVETDFYVL